MSTGREQMDLKISEILSVLGTMAGEDLAHFTVAYVCKNGNLGHFGSFAERSGEIALLAHCIEDLAFDINHHGDTHDEYRH